MKAAIENFANIPSSNKYLLLGSMAELGADSLDEHRELVNLIQQHHFTNVVLVGKHFGDISHPYLQFNTAAEAKDWWLQQHAQNAYVLVKGSRSMKMENIIN